MRKFANNLFLACGLLLTLAAFPVFAQVEDVKFNKRPLQDFGKWVSEKIVEKEVNLTAPFSIELNGVLNKDGKFDIKQTNFIKSDGDTNMIEVVKNGISALNDSGFFFYLTNYGVEKINLVISQDENIFSSTLRSELKSPAHANSVTSGYNLIIAFVKDQKKNQKEGILLNAMRTSAQGKFFVLNFAMPKMDLQNLIQDELRSNISEKTQENRLRQPINIDNPFKRFASAYKTQIKSKNVDLSKPFNLVFEVNLDEQLNLKSAEYVKTEGSPEILKIAKLGMEFISRNMAFQYYGKQTFVGISQDSANLSVSFRFAMPTENDAAEAAAKENLNIGYEKVLPPNLDAESAEFLLNVETKLKAEGKFLIMEYSVPKQYFQKIVNQEFDKIEKD